MLLYLQIVISSDVANEPRSLSTTRPSTKLALGSAVTVGPSVGNGVAVGSSLVDGSLLGNSVGWVLGSSVGTLLPVGAAVVGSKEGVAVGAVGDEDGSPRVGNGVGGFVGNFDGFVGAPGTTGSSTAGADADGASVISMRLSISVLGEFWDD